MSSMNPIQGIAGVEAIGPARMADFGLESTREAHDAEKGNRFGAALGGMLKEVDELQKASGEALSDFSDGKIDDVSDVMAAMSRADLSFRMMLEVRNKLVDAYQDVMRTQV